MAEGQKVSGQWITHVYLRMCHQSCVASLSNVKLHPFTAASMTKSRSLIVAAEEMNTCESNLRWYACIPTSLDLGHLSELLVRCRTVQKLFLKPFYNVITIILQSIVKCVVDNTVLTEVRRSQRSPESQQIGMHAHLQ